MPDTPRSFEDDALAREVDRLLQKLPGADPYLKGEGERPAAGAGVVLGEAPSAVLARRQGSRPGPTRVQRLAVWVRVLMGALLGAVISQWPYGRSCGLGLGLYLAAISVVPLAGTWAAVWSWRYQLGRAHVASIGVIYWGVVLAAEQVLPRVGYAAASAAWACGR
jgi:hypothetical protein